MAFSFLNPEKAVAGWMLAMLTLAAAAPSNAQPQCALPVLTADGWERSEPQASGFDAAALCAVLDGVAKGEANIHGVIVERKGRLVAELYRSGKDRSIYSLYARDTQFGPEVLHDVRSVSKSIVGLLIGIARGQGRIGDPATPVLGFFPEFPDLRTAERNSLTIEHLLTMSTGLQWHEGAPAYGILDSDEIRLFWKWSPYHYVLSRPVVAAPGAKFNYNGGNTAVLAEILMRSTRKSLQDLAREMLFDPLGITEWEWVRDPHRRALAFAGLRMRPRDLAKVGRMLLDRGKWRGREVVPADWVAASLQARIPTGDNVQYGYQWWMGSVDWQGRKLAWSGAIGNGGQRLYMVPELDLAVTITSGWYDEPISPIDILRKVVNSVRI